MSASLPSLPTELVELICIIQPSIMKSLRSTCRDMDRKTARVFSTEYFTSVSFSATPRSVSMLLQVSLSPRLCNIVRELRFSVRDWSTVSRWRGRSDYTSTGAFRLQLSMILRRLPNCVGVIFDWSEPLGGAHEDDYESSHRYPPGAIYQLGMENPFDLSEGFLEILRSIADAKAGIRKLVIQDDTASIVELSALWQRLAKLPCEELHVPSLELLQTSFSNEGIQETEIVPRCPHALGLGEQASMTYEIAVQHCLAHAPNLKSLHIQAYDSSSCMLYALGAHLEELELVGFVLHEDRNGARMLLEVLHRSPKIRTLRFHRLLATTMAQISELLDGLIELPSLKTVSVEYLMYEDWDGDFLCLTSSCTSSYHRTRIGAWTATVIPADLREWSRCVHIDP